MWKRQLQRADDAVSELLPRYKRWTQTRSKIGSRAHSEPLSLYLLSKTTKDGVVFKLGESRCPVERLEGLVGGAWDPPGGLVP